jgi:hypothetical protein
LVVSVVLHLIVFGVGRESKRVTAHDPTLPDAIEVVSISDLPPVPEPPGDPQQQASGAPRQADVAAASAGVSAQQPLQAALLADLRAGMLSLTGLKRARLTMDESDIALASAQAADTILAAPYPFARVGGARIGLGGGGGNCPAAPFP